MILTREIKVKVSESNYQYFDDLGYEFSIGDEINIPVELLSKGSHHKMMLSNEQNKKINKAHIKGSGITLCLDPYQQDMHSRVKPSVMAEVAGEGLPKHRGRPRKVYSQKGDGILDNIKGAFRSAGDSVKSVSQKVKGGISSVGNVVKSAGNEFVDDVRSSGRPIASHLIHTGLPIFTSSAGSVLGGLATENPLGAVAGGMAGKYAGEALGDYIGHKTGYGLKKKRGKKQGGALLPAGY